LTSIIQHNAARLREVHGRIGETYARRGESDEAWTAWQEACAEYHARYDELAFPGGLAAGLEKIRRSDGAACEMALRYLEEPPYCIRSQYVMEDLKRALNKATLRADLAERFRAWKEKRARERALRRAQQQDQ